MPHLLPVHVQFSLLRSLSEKFINSARYAEICNLLRCSNCDCTPLPPTATGSVVISNATLFESNGVNQEMGRWRIGRVGKSMKMADFSTKQEIFEVLTRRG